MGEKQIFLKIIPEMAALGMVFALYYNRIDAFCRIRPRFPQKRRCEITAPGMGYPPPKV
jgi:hypothetical protein